MGPSWWGPSRQRSELTSFLRGYVDRVSVPSPIAVDILMVRSGVGQSSHMYLFSV